MFFDLGLPFWDDFAVVSRAFFRCLFWVIHLKPLICCPQKCKGGEHVRLISFLLCFFFCVCVFAFCLLMFFSFLFVFVLCILCAKITTPNQTAPNKPDQTELNKTKNEKNKRKNQEPMHKTRQPPSLSPACLERRPWKNL